MKHILIPTDFSIRSLNAVHAAVAKHKDVKLKISLFHLLDMSNDISELLFRSLRNRHYKMVGEDFKEACQILQNKYSSAISIMSVQFGFGNTLAYVNNYLEGASVEEIIVCAGEDLQLPSDRSIAMMPLFKRANIPVHIAEHHKHRFADINTLPTGNELRIPKKDEYVVER